MPAQRHLAITPIENDDEYRMRSASTGSRIPRQYPRKTSQAGSFWPTKGVLSKLGCLFDPQPEQKGGRTIQLCWLTSFAVLALAAIAVQVYTEAEMADARKAKNQTIAYCQELANNLYDLVELIGQEMALAYENNNGSYDDYLSKSQEVMRAVDTALMWMPFWLSEKELLSVPSALRVNITTPTELRFAIRAQRELRKTSANGVSEMSVLNFYITIIDQLSVLARNLISDAPRFPGWQNFLGVTPMFQLWMNFKKYVAIGRKMSYEKRTLSVNDPLFAILSEFYNRYIEYFGVVSVISSYARAKLVNLTDQDSTKDVEKMHAEVLRKGVASINSALYSEALDKQDKNIEWALQVVRAKAREQIRDTMGDWPDVDAFAVPIFAVAAAIGAFAVLVHVIATWRQQRQTILYHSKLRDLNDALVLLYDCIPKSFIDKARSCSLFPIQQHEDTCIAIIDIYNVNELAKELELESFVAVMEQTYEIIEHCLIKYNCFKVDVTGSYFALASGAGGHSLMDHVLQMVLSALDMQDAIAERSDLDKDDDYEIRLRVGIHVGACYTRVVYLQVPRMAIVGPVVRMASLIHSCSLPMAVQVSAAVSDRLQGMSDELNFLRRGRLDIEGMEDLQGDLYWVRWAEDSSQQAFQESSRRSSVATDYI